jgi:hypothetical protein
MGLHSHGNLTEPLWVIHQQVKQVGPINPIHFRNIVYFKFRFWQLKLPEHPLRLVGTANARVDWARIFIRRKHITLNYNFVPSQQI